MNFSPTRRAVLALAAAGLALPARLLASGEASARRFLFVYARGGWDPSYVFAPLFDNPNVDTEADATEAVVSGIPFVDAAARPAVRAFFDTWGSGACVLNGMEVRSIAHEKARQLLFTGTAADADDWGSILASSSAEDLEMPFAVATGPTFNKDLAADVVRFGSAGQLGALLDGSALVRPDGVVAASAGAAAAVEAAVMARTVAKAEAGGGGRNARWTAELLHSRERLARLRTVSAELGFSRDASFPAKLAGVVNALELGLCRVAMVEHNGVRDLSWDTHADNAQQSMHYQDLFTALGGLLADLARRPGPAGGRLLDEVTVVVLSELGRHPKLNAFAGKDHWTFTSAMLVGAGVAGGQSLGGWDDQVVGRAIDLTTGELTASGTRLASPNLGATLLALGDVDPTPYCGGAEPILAAIS